MFLHKKSKVHNKYTREFIESYLERITHGRIIWSTSIAQYTADMILVVLSVYDETLRNKLDDNIDIIARFMQAMEIEHLDYEMRKIEFSAADEVGYILMKSDDEFDVKHLEKYNIRLEFNLTKTPNIAWKIDRCYFRNTLRPNSYTPNYPSEHKLKR